MASDLSRRERTRRRLASTSYRAVVDHERYYSLFAVAAVKTMLFMFLLAFFGLMLKLMRTSFQNVGGTYRIFLGAMIVVVALVLGADIRKNILQIIALRKELHDRRRD